jgi:uncharacterized protein YbjT (DUF2867 family)
MKVLVLGANGKTGNLVVNQVVAMSYEISVLVRRTFGFYPAGVQVIIGDALKAEDLQRAMDKQNAVVECIGGTKPWKKQTLERDVMRNIVKAMENSGAKRLVVVSAMGVGESANQSPWWYHYLMLPTFLRRSTADKTAMEDIVRKSKLDWVIARPPVLKHEASTGKVHVMGKNEMGHAITRADLAMWLVDQLADTARGGQAVLVANS